MKYTVILLSLYGLSVTGWYQYDTEQKDILTVRVAELEGVILEQEKVILEMENAPPVECVVVKPYTYDQWVTEKPCPPGKRGPLCHMPTPDKEKETVE